MTSEFYPDHPVGHQVDGVLNQDIQRLTFESRSIDVVTSSQVFEHVPDDLQGFRECHRVLKSGGALILSIPLYELPSTKRIAIFENSRVVFLEEPEYHDSRTAGVGSAPVFWHHAISDIADRVKSAGFHSAALLDVTVATRQKITAKVVYAIK